MTTSTISSPSIGWAAVATGIAGLLALAFIILFFTIGQPFGTLNDIFIAIAAILCGLLAWVSYPQFYAQSPLLSRVALVVALVGALVVVIGSVLVIFGITGWFLAGLYTSAGNALIGLWLLGLTYSAWQNNSLPNGLAISGIVIGVIMILGLAAIPGIVSRIDAWDAAPWYVTYVGLAGGLGWLVLYPVWCVWLGRTLLPN